ncbi:hypothetical protein MKX08_002448 [Trichoderma sp. CBMAI-0020]|nr:hypothetical protein MKX08_002448 [Trichoderma sp. CBMAI-0020]
MAQSTNNLQDLAAPSTPIDGNIKFAIGILSVGLDNEEANHQNTLLIAVKPNSLSWSRGNTLALRCKAILEEHGIRDMHCKIRESDVILLADTSSPQPPPPATSPPDNESETLPSELQLSFGPIAFDDNVTCRANLTDYLGTTITTVDRSYLTGTKGYYLSLNRKPEEGDPTTVMLFCRHVAMDSKTEANGLKEYRYDPSQTRREAIQMGQKTYQAMVDDLDENALAFADRAAKQGRRHETDRAAINEILAKNSRAFSRTMKRYAAPSSRVFGHLLYASDFMPCTSSGSGQWRRDWALIELDSSRHQTSLGSLSNMVFVGVLDQRAFKAIMRRCERWKGIPAPTPKIDDYAFQLKKAVVPMNELFRPPHVTAYREDNAILVAKYGKTTGLTIVLATL